jgi:hypothetical protein
MGCPNLRTLVLIRTGQASLGVRTAGLAVDRSALRRRDGRHGGRGGGGAGPSGSLNPAVRTELLNVEQFPPPAFES